MTYRSLISPCRGARQHLSLKDRKSFCWTLTLSLAPSFELMIQLKSLLMVPSSRFKSRRNASFSSKSRGLAGAPLSVTSFVGVEGSSKTLKTMTTSCTSTTSIQWARATSLHPSYLISSVRSYNKLSLRNRFSRLRRNRSLRVETIKAISMISISSRWSLSIRKSLPLSWTHHSRVAISQSYARA